MTKGFIFWKTELETKILKKNCSLLPKVKNLKRSNLKNLWSFEKQCSQELTAGVQTLGKKDIFPFGAAKSVSSLRAFNHTELNLFDGSML